MSFIHYQFKAQDRCERTVANYAWPLNCVPYPLKTQEIYERAVNDYNRQLLKSIPDQYKTQE